MVTKALKEGTGRFDASDLMPTEVGSGTFWTGMVEYVRGGPDTLDGVLSDIEASWPSRHGLWAIPAWHWPGWTARFRGRDGPACGNPRPPT